MWGTHRLTANSLATLVTRLRVQRSTVAGHVVLWRENYHPAIFDFCNNIGQIRTPAAQQMHRFSMTSSAWSSSVIGKVRFADVEPADEALVFRI
jgi:hypothetical protein